MAGRTRWIQPPTRMCHLCPKSLEAGGMNTAHRPTQTPGSPGLSAMRKALALTLGACLLSSSGALSREQACGARKFVALLYQRYHAKSSPDYLGSRAVKIFTPDLLGEIRADARNAHGEDGKLDFDPICDCQDSEGLQLSSLSIQPQKSGNVRAYAGIRLDMERRMLELDLVWTSDGWRIGDIHTKALPSLLRYLQTP